MTAPSPARSARPTLDPRPDPLPTCQRSALRATAHLKFTDARLPPSASIIRASGEVTFSNFSRKDFRSLRAQVSATLHRLILPCRNSRSPHASAPPECAEARPAFPQPTTSARGRQDTASSGPVHGNVSNDTAPQLCGTLVCDSRSSILPQKIRQRVIRLGARVFPPTPTSAHCPILGALPAPRRKRLAKSPACAKRQHPRVMPAAPFATAPRPQATIIAAPIQRIHRPPDHPHRIRRRQLLFHLHGRYQRRLPAQCAHSCLERHHLSRSHSQ